MVTAVSQLASLAGLCSTPNAKVQCLGGKDNSLHMYRPADVQIGNMLVDITIVSPLSASKATSKQGQTPGTLVTSAADAKVRKHRDPASNAGFDFLPFAIDTCGSLAADARYILSYISYKYSSTTCKPLSAAKYIIVCRISFALHLGIARQLVACFNDCSELTT